MRPLVTTALLALWLATGLSGPAGAAAPPADPPPVTSGLPASAAPPPTAIPPPGAGVLGPSRAIGAPNHGRLAGGVLLPEAGPDWITWDPVLKRSPNRDWRRWGTRALIDTLTRVLADYHVAHPYAPPALVADLSRPEGGVFDRRFGGLGHASHQNGLDVDVMYPRRDARLRAAWRPRQVDRRLAQDLVDRFVAAGAQYVFVGLRSRLRGPRRVVQAIPNHDDHLHVRIRPPRPDGG